MIVKSIMVNNISIGVGCPRGALHVLKGTAFELSPYSVLCTRVYTVMYPRVHSCIHACTQRRSLLLRLGVHVGCAEWLSSALQKGSYQGNEWARASSIDSLCPALWLAFLCSFPIPPINNVPACEGIGNLRSDLELW